jgi:uncharacterized membrane protein
MTDPLATPPASQAAPREDQVFPIAVYVLYLIGLMNGVTILIGVIMAYALKEKATEPYLSHNVFQIRTFWMGLAGGAAASVIAAAGVPLMFIGIGFLLFALSGLMFAALWVWFLVRSVLGLITLAQGYPYARPRSWIV